MCIFEKLSPECEKENSIYCEQMRRLVLYFLNIDDIETRESLIDFLEKVSKLSKYNKNENQQN
jgi:hypothetical protein